MWTAGSSQTVICEVRHSIFQHLIWHRVWPQRPTRKKSLQKAQPAHNSHTRLPETRTTSLNNFLIFGKSSFYNNSQKHAVHLQELQQRFSDPPADKFKEVAKNVVSVLSDSGPRSLSFQQTGPITRGPRAGFRPGSHIDVGERNSALTAACVAQCSLEQPASFDLRGSAALCCRRCPLHRQFATHNYLMVAPARATGFAFASKS